MARLPTGRASTTGLAGARVLFRRLQAQGSARRSRQSGRVVTTAVYLSLGAIQRKALPTKPTGSGIQQNPACGLVDVCRRGTEGVQDEPNRDVKLRKR